MPYGSGKYTYEVVDSWAKLPEGASFLDIGGFCIDGLERVYVLNRSAELPVMVFVREGSFLTSWGKGLFKRAHGSGVGRDGAIYCTDDKNLTVRKFTPEGKLLMTLGTEDQPSDTGYVQDWFDFFWSLTTIAKGGPPFNRPTGVSIAESGNIYVSDGYGNARVHKYSPEGELLFSWGEYGTDPGQFNLVHSICTDRDGYVYIADRESHRVQVFDPSGKYLTQWNNLHRPCGLHITGDGEGLCYIGQLGPGLPVNKPYPNLGARISIHNLKGERLAWLGDMRPGEEPGQFIAPHGIAVDSRGDLYIGEVSWAEMGRHLDPPREVRSFRKLVRLT